MDWHKATRAEVRGDGYDILLDVLPGEIADEAAEYEDVLVRTGRPGWTWWARSVAKDKRWNEMGECDTKEQALEDGLEAIRLRQAMEDMG